MSQDKQLSSHVTLEQIQKMVLHYSAKMNAIAKFLEENNAPKEIRIDTATEYLEFYIDSISFDGLNAIRNNPEFSHFGAFFGLDPQKNNKTTACFLGMNKENKILSAHKKIVGPNNTVIDPELPGFEDWPPPYEPPQGESDLTLNSTPQEIINLLS